MLTPPETVKPIALMRYLITLITPPGGTVLDMFAGSGTTGCAAALLGFNFVGIEQDAEYAEIARRRIAHMQEHGEWWLDAAKATAAGTKESGVYGGGKGRHVRARCPEHGASQGKQGTSRDYQCGCRLIYVDSTRDEPRHTESHDTPPSLNDLPLFGQAAD